MWVRWKIDDEWMMREYINISIQFSVEGLNLMLSVMIFVLGYGFKSFYHRGILSKEWKILKMITDIWSARPLG